MQVNYKILQQLVVDYCDYYEFVAGDFILEAIENARKDLHGSTDVEKIHNRIVEYYL